MMSYDVVRVSPPENIMGTQAAPQLLTAARIATSIVDVSDFREVTLLLEIDAGAAANQVSIFPLMASQDEPPATAIVDQWMIPSVVDGTVTAGTPGGAILSGSPITLAPAFGQVTARPLEVLTVATAAATDEIRMAITFKCGWARWFHAQLADIGGAGTLASVFARAVRNS